MRFVEAHEGHETFESGYRRTVDIELEATADFIRAQISSIYSRKEETVTRELMANGFDSHVMAGCPQRPIEVHLPTALEPTFVVRDYGVGMDDDFIMTAFARLGKTTKADRDDQTGMFGIGSKSPLSISDNFTIKTYDGERARTYLLSLESGKKPQLHDVMDIACDDPQGVEVTVPVLGEARHKILAGVAKQQFSWFDKPVEFIGAIREIEHHFYRSIKKIAPSVWIGVPASNNKDGWSLFVRQGASVYPVDKDQVEDLLRPGHIEYVEGMSSKGNHMLIDIPIGTCNVTMSREDIQYDSQSCENLASHLTARLSVLENELCEVVGDAVNYVEAMERMLHRMSDQERWGSLGEMRATAGLFGMIRPQVRANWAKRQEAWVEEQKSQGFDDKTIQEFVAPWQYSPTRNTVIEGHRLSLGKHNLYTGRLNYYGEVSARIDEKSKSNATFALPNILYVIPSSVGHWRDKVSAHVRTTFANEGKDADDTAIVVVRCAKKNLERVVEDLQRYGVYMGHYGAEDLPDFKPSPKQKAETNRSKSAVYIWESGEWPKDKVEPDYAEPAYFVVREGQTKSYLYDLSLFGYGKPFLPSTNTRHRISGDYTFRGIRRAAKHFKMLDDDVPLYRITEKQAERIKLRAPEWIPLFHHISDATHCAVRAQTSLALKTSQLSSTDHSPVSRLLDVTLRCKRVDFEQDNFRAHAYRLLLRLMNSCEAYRLQAAVRFAIKRNLDNLAQDTTLRSLQGDIWGSHTMQGIINDEVVERYNVVDNFVHSTWSIVETLTDSSPTTQQLINLKIFLDGLELNGWPEATINRQDYSELDVFVDALQGELELLPYREEPVAAPEADEGEDDNE